MRFYLTSIFIFLTFTTYAQIKIQGNVKDKAKKSIISDVYIMLISEDGKRILSSSYSNNDGFYSINIPKGNGDKFIVSTTRLGYDSYKVKIKIDKENIVKHDILLSETAIKLKEVTIKSPPVRKRGDTINYRMSEFVRSQDRNLADALARMPGITMKKDGRIDYNGKAINRFYIEDMNLLERRYSLATKNLSPSDIATVQILENHEPIKALRDRTDSEQAAVNIKLKSTSRSTWLKTLDFGIGAYPILYDASGTLARFAKGNQTMMVAKANNMGRNIFEELKRHNNRTGIFRIGIAERITDMLNPISVSIGMETYDNSRFNTTTIVSLNQLWRVAEDTDLRTNINYGYDREERSRSVTTEYFLDNSPAVTISDITSQVVRLHKTEVELGYTANKSTFHLEDKISINIQKKEATAELYINDKIMHQQMQLPRLQIKNELKYVKPAGKFVFDFFSNSEYNSLPQTLEVSSDKELPMFSSNVVKQNIILSDIYSDNNINFSLRRKLYTWKIIGGAELWMQDLKSSLQPTPNLDETFMNNLSGGTMRLYFSPKLSIGYKRVSFDALVSINNLVTSHNNERETKFYINPNLKFKYEITGNLKADIGYNRKMSFGKVADMHNALIMKSYRYMSKSIEEQSEYASQTTQYGLSYRNVLQLANISFNGFYSIYNKNHSSARRINDIYTISSYIQKPSQSNFLMNTINLSKMFYSISLNTKVSFSHSIYNETTTQQNRDYKYKLEQYSISPSINWATNEKINFVYSLNYSLSGLFLKGINKENYIPTINHSFAVYYDILSNTHIGSKIRHFRLAPPQTNITNLIFWDISLRQRFKKVTVSIDWTNILNQDRSEMVNYTSINKVTVIDKLRPREIFISFRFKR